MSEIIKKIVLRKKNADILIVGKGATIDKIDCQKTNSFLKICVNDSDNIVNGDFCIFRHEWVSKKINKEGSKSTLYITNQKLNASTLSTKEPFAGTVPQEEEEEGEREEGEREAASVV